MEHGMYFIIPRYYWLLFPFSINFSKQFSVNDKKEEYIGRIDTRIQGSITTSDKDYFSLHIKRRVYVIIYFLLVKSIIC